MVPVFWSAPTPENDFLVESVDARLFGREPGLDVLSGLVEGGCRAGMLCIANESSETLLIEPGDVLATLATADPDEVLILDSRADGKRILLEECNGVFVESVNPCSSTSREELLSCLSSTSYPASGQADAKGRRKSKAKAKSRAWTAQDKVRAEHRNRLGEGCKEVLNHLIQD